MKKLISLIAIMLLGLATFAQTNVQMGGESYFYEYTGVATADTVGGTVTTWNKPILLNSYDAVLYYIKAKVTETAGFACTIKLQGKYFSADTYSDITTVTYTGVGTDTTVVFNEGSTASRYRYFNILVTRTAGTGKISFVKASFKR